MSCIAVPAMTSPIDLPHQLDRRELTCRAILETPCGSSVKYSFDPDTGLYAVGKLLPAGMAFPFDFGFIPSTVGGDGDPLDIILLPETGLAVGCTVEVRLLGLMEAEQKAPGGGPERNDRILARLSESILYSGITEIDQFGEGFTDAIATFFATYKRLRGQTYDTLATRGPDQAAEMIAKCSRPLP